MLPPIFKKTFVWLLFLAPGLLMICHGLGAVLNERLVSMGRRSFGRITYGDDAVGWGWIFLGFGFAALGEMASLLAKRVVIRVIGWILAVGASSIGCWVLLRSS